ncbi:acetyl-CoA synthetase-like protein [Eremomyces bilateralis CBS 781.70]|uniref:Acetyl-CoA synthetase-like protein n=1 Tax=Eremomyces bilateralis CBS 781.70 TaxID=1392243 RepID=A0A6G1FR23_9PEZI|nr:acetyl-CoA synthetase-like protein [Eremomyces bilateralis CBS 781.70]KAF1808223.1 acetyl-CoA synthetase-like protein [Eremomyces bilateralis CBS 781.70]
MDSIPRWFEGVRLNFAENVLFSPVHGTPTATSTRGKESDKVATTEVREGGTEIRAYTWAQLRSRVALFANALRARGVKKGDRVAVVASNSFDTLCVFLATTSLGGLFSSSSTDMGTKGVLDRLLQIKPRFVFIDDIAVYNGKTTDLRPKIKEILDGMSNVEEFWGAIIQPRFERAVDISAISRSETLANFLKSAGGNTKLTFERVEFRDPFLVVYSSGTTGVPKCIVHSTGGILLNSMKEGKLHRDLGPDMVQLQYTTTGWIMYMSSILSLLYGGHAILYDGSPFQPDLKTFIRLVSFLKVTNLGISPRYMHEFQKNNLAPRDIADLSRLRTVTSTGMVLSDALFEWFYDTGFPPHAQLANISGGTDLAGCFSMENPLTPIYVGGCVGPSVGTAIAAYDQTIEGNDGTPGSELEDGVPGELVATRPFPNMPVYFWGDDKGEKYFSSYFKRFNDVWTHGDFIMIHPITKQIFFLGRADGVLNPSGVRFGSAEIYSVIENFFTDQIADSICVGQRRPEDDDESVLLFLLMHPGKKFNQLLVKDVKDRIGKELSKRHVPKYVFETREIPTTVNLKKVELPVKQIVSGKIIKPSGTLLNPESLDFYYKFAKIEELDEEGRVTSKL